MGKSVEVAAIPQKLATLSRALAKAEKAEDVIKISAQAAGIEELLKKAGFYRAEEMRPVRELYLDARCELGVMLRKVLRGAAGRPKQNNNLRPVGNFKDELTRLSLTWPRVIEVQRASYLPLKERRGVYADAKRQEILPTLDMLIDVARPYWYKESRKAKHRDIAARARAQQQTEPDTVGPFPLIYADPAWTFNTYSEMGLEKTPTQHYQTMTDDEIISMKVFGKTIPELASPDAACLMWCTSSNLERALAVMEAWGFTYTSSAVWVKTRDDGITPISGMGLVFRNMHEVLLYGKRGSMPGPQYQPPSVFFYPRGRHSAKPPEIRGEIEKMYPDFDTDTRIELFSRDSVPGWTHFGFEANDADSSAQAAE
jgi:N6-adenosine-specific RNA methylase IME4